MNLAPSIDVEDLPEALAQQHLPEALKDTCLVIPKRLLTWTSVNIMVLGIGMGMLLSGLLSEWITPSTLTYGFPVALGIAWLIARTILTKCERRFLEQATG